MFHLALGLDILVAPKIQKLEAILGEEQLNESRVLNRVCQQSQSDLAATLDTAKEAIGRLERGLVAPSLGRLDRIADALGVPLIRLLTDEAVEVENKVVAEFVRLLDAVGPANEKALLQIIRSLADLQGVATREPSVPHGTSPDVPLDSTDAEPRHDIPDDTSLEGLRAYFRDKSEK